MEKLQAPQRKEWLDALRGLAMLLVVLLHNMPASPEKYIYVLISGPIKLPLFFAISGYVFNGRGGKQGAFFLNLLRKIVIPSLVLFLCLRAVFIPTRGFSYVTQGLLEFLSGETCWYITACIFGEILFFYILKFFKKDWHICVAAGVCCLLGFVMAVFGIGNFAMINRAFIAQYFFALGYMFRRHEDCLKKLHWAVPLGALLLCAGLIIGGYFLFPDRGLDVHLNNYYGSLETIPFSFLLITLATLSLMILGAKLGRISKLLSIAGRHTLITYIFHGFFLSIGMRVLPHGDSTGFLLFAKCLVLSCFSVAVCCLGGAILDRLFPELMGRKRKKKEKI